MSNAERAYGLGAFKAGRSVTALRIFTRVVISADIFSRISDNVTVFIVRAVSHHFSNIKDDTVNDAI
jgi:hypothetical protein